LTFCGFLGVMLGGHVRAVFTLITILFIICVSATITSFREIPLYLLKDMEDAHPDKAGLQFPL
jgi:solute carrier family 45, member 1/2/4